MLHLISIFVLKSPRAVLQPANLQFPCINLLKQCIDDPNEIVSEKKFENAILRRNRFITPNKLQFPFFIAHRFS